MTTTEGLEERLDNEMVVVMQVREARANLLGAKDKAKGSVLAHVEAAFQETDQALKEQEQLAAKVTADIFALTDAKAIAAEETAFQKREQQYRAEAKRRAYDPDGGVPQEEKSDARTEIQCPECGAIFKSIVDREKPEPERKPKFQVGQWVETPVFRGVPHPGGNVGRVTSYTLDTKHVWVIGCIWDEGDLKPHAPVLTDAQRMMLPGDKVRVIKIPVDLGGNPEVRIAGGRWKIRRLERVLEAVSADLCGCGSTIVTLSRWLHNLEPVEEAEEGGG